MIYKNKYGVIQEWHYKKRYHNCFTKNMTEIEIRGMIKEIDDEIKDAILGILSTGTSGENADEIITEHIIEYWETMEQKYKNKILSCVNKE